MAGSRGAGEETRYPVHVRGEAPAGASPSAASSSCQAGAPSASSSCQAGASSASCQASAGAHPTARHVDLTAARAGYARPAAHAAGGRAAERHAEAEAGAESEEGCDP